MRQKLNIITLGVADLPKALAFYEKGLKWKKSKASNENIAFFQLGGIVLSIFSKKALAEDAGVSAEENGFSAITLAYNTKSEEEVDAVLNEVKNLGAEIVKPPAKVHWGGYSGYFKDFDGHLFEVAYNPFVTFDDKDNIII